MKLRNIERCLEAIREVDTFLKSVKYLATNIKINTKEFTNTKRELFVQQIEKNLTPLLKEQKELIEKELLESAQSQESF